MGFERCYIPWIDKCRRDLFIGGGRQHALGNDIDPTPHHSKLIHEREKTRKRVTEVCIREADKNTGRIARDHSVVV